MKILFFMEDYYLGGVDTFVINTINYWPHLDDEIVLVCNQSHAGISLIRDSLIRQCEIRLHEIAIFTGFFERAQTDFLSKCKLFLLRLAAPIVRYLYLVGNCIMLKRLFRDIAADKLLIINGGYPGGDSCRAASIAWAQLYPRNLSVHNFHGIVTPARLHVRLQEQLVDARVARSSKTLVTVSRATADSMRSRSAITRHASISFIYNGVAITNSTVENGIDLRSELNIQHNARVGIMLGGYHQHKHFDKGHDFLFHVLRNVMKVRSDFHLVICGFGSVQDIDRVRQLAARYDLDGHVHFFGFRNDIPRLLSQADVLTVASQAFESFCFAAIEAMALKVPVVATNVGAIPEIVMNGEGGYCVERTDSTTYTQRLLQLLENEQSRKEQGAKGYERYRALFTAQRMAQQYAELVRSS